MIGPAAGSSVEITWPRILAPRIETPPPEPRPRQRRVPAAGRRCSTEQVQRLAVCTAVGAGLWTYGLVMDTVVRPLTSAPTADWRNVIIEIVGHRSSPSLMFLYVPLRAARAAA